MEYLTLTNSTEIIRIASEDIVFIKGDGNYSDIYTYPMAKRRT